MYYEFVESILSLVSFTLYYRVVCEFRVCRVLMTCKYCLYNYTLDVMNLSDIQTCVFVINKDH